jgi:tryptophanyl-tRNA synthetase
MFAYLDASDPDTATVGDLKSHYRRGGLRDAVIKRRLEDILHAFHEPIRPRREDYAREPGYVLDVIRRGTEAAREVTAVTAGAVANGLGLFRL